MPKKPDDAYRQTIRFSPELYRRLLAFVYERKIQGARGANMNDVVNTAVELYLAKHERRDVMP